MSRLQSVKNEISSVTTEIDSYKSLISKLTSFTAKIKSTSLKLNDTYSNLSEGLIIDGDSADGGALEEKSLKLSKNCNEIQSIIGEARREQNKLEIKLTSLYAEKRKLEYEEAREKYKKSKVKKSDR